MNKKQVWLTERNWNFEITVFKAKYMILRYLMHNIYVQFSVGSAIITILQDLFYYISHLFNYYEHWRRISCDPPLLLPTVWSSVITATGGFSCYHCHRLVFPLSLTPVGWFTRCHCHRWVLPSSVPPLGSPVITATAGFSRYHCHRWVLPLSLPPGGSPVKTATGGFSRYHCHRWVLPLSLCYAQWSETHCEIIALPSATLCMQLPPPLQCFPPPSESPLPPHAKVKKLPFSEWCFEEEWKIFSSLELISYSLQFGNDSGNVRHWNLSQCMYIAQPQQLQYFPYLNCYCQIFF